MVRRKTVLVAVAWIVSLVSTALWAQGNIQSESRGSVMREIRPGQAIGQVISSGDIGFQRLANPNERPGTLTGRWMVRLNGEWLVATGPAGVAQPLAH
jgi:hypothetical protein